MATSEMNYTLRRLGQVQGVKIKSFEQLVYLFDFKCITSGLIDLLQNVFTDIYCGGKDFYESYLCCTFVWHKGSSLFFMFVLGFHASLVLIKLYLSCREL